MAAKVLLIRFSSLGDVVLTTAAVEALREDQAGLEVHVLTKPAFREVFSDHPGVARVLEWSPSEGLQQLARAIRAQRYEWVVDLHRNLRSRSLRALARWPRRSACRKGSLRRRAAVRLHRPRLLDSVHVVDRYIAALKPLGVRSFRRLPRVYPGAARRERAFDALRDAGWDGVRRVLALAPGARWQTKTWPAQHWVELVERIRETELGFPVLVGGSEDQPLCSQIVDSAGFGGSLAGRSSILDTAAAFALSAAVVTGDSAPLHLATAAGAPVVALFGPTVRGFGFYPLGGSDLILEKPLSCRPCSLHGGDSCPEGHHLCMKGISPSAVFNRLQQVVLPT